MHKVKKWLSLALASMLVFSVVAVAGAAEAVEIFPGPTAGQAAPVITAAPVQVTPVPEKVAENATQAPAQDPTQAPAQDPTQAPAQDPTQAPAQDPTQAPAQDPTQEPVQEPTQDPTQEPTQDPTQEPTQDPTQEPTQDPTQEPTEEPTQEPTEEPTETPTMEPEFGGSVIVEFRHGKPGSFQYGDKVVLDALLTGYEGRKYRLTWQCSEDGREWEDASGSKHATSYQFRLNEENAYWSWRVAVDLL